MNGNRNQTATGVIPPAAGPRPPYSQRYDFEQLVRYYRECLQKDLNLQPSGNECISGAVEHGFSGHRIPGNPAPSAEHRAKGQQKTATEPQSWGGA